jgi:hypothetical protein
MGAKACIGSGGELGDEAGTRQAMIRASGSIEHVEVVPTIECFSKVADVAQEVICTSRY